MSANGAKYAVFKIQDWEQFVADFPQTASYLQLVPDAVVIRRQDIFAAPALDAYANAILVAAQVLNSDDSAQLQGIADYFHLEASKAWQAPNRKIPD